ncbi:MAG: hypothetical protein ACTTIZ_01815 [Treponema sp.]
MSYPTMPTQLEIDFEEKFNASVYISFLGEGYLYSSRKEDEPCYELFSLTKNEIDTLMEQSLKEDKDLLFEACKDRPYDEAIAFKNLGIKI